MAKKASSKKSTKKKAPTAAEKKAAKKAAEDKKLAAENAATKEQETTTNVDETPDSTTPPVETQPPADNETQPDADTDESATDDSKQDPPDETKPPVETQPPAAEVKKDVPAVSVSRSVSFFEQYLANLKLGKPVVAMISINNCFKEMLKTKDEEVYNDILDCFVEHRSYLVPKTLLQGAAKLAIRDRGVVEIVITVLSTLADAKGTKKTVRMSIDRIRDIVKSESFANWVTKQTRK